ncbi:MAG: hypothetical protein ACLGG7_07440 [Bacteriovoracia bacterium]
MWGFVKRTILFLLATLPLAQAVSARMTDRRDPLFRIETEQLEKGEVHYAFYQLDASTIQKKLPEFVDLDGLRFLEREGVTVQIVKLAYVVNKPAGFFSDAQMKDPRWVSLVLGAQVSQISEGHYQVGPEKFHVAYDSDDLTSVRNSRIVHAVTQSKKLDPIALSSFSTVVLHSSDMLQVDNHVPLSTKKSLVVSYQLTVVKKKTSAKKQRASFLEATRARLARTYP